MGSAARAVGLGPIPAQLVAAGGGLPALVTTQGPAVTSDSQPSDRGRLGREPTSLGLLAATAIAVVWGGILAIAQMEQLLAPEVRWWGHAFVHLWIATWTTVIAVTAARVLRSGRASGRALRVAVVSALVLSTAAAVANLLEIVGAYPTLREFHDAVNRVGTPVGWLLLANLILIVALSLHPRVGRG